MDAKHFIGEFDDQQTLRIELSYRESPEVVWRAITDPDQVAKWFMLVPLEPRRGGSVMLRSVSRGTDTGTRGTIAAFDPPALLEYEFRDTDLFDGTLRFEVTSDGDGCRMAFTQRLAPHMVWTHEPDGTGGTVGPEAAPGWQDFFVESLGAFLEGRPLPTATEVADRKLVRTEQCRSLLATRFGSTSPASPTTP